MATITVLRRNDVHPVGTVRVGISARSRSGRCAAHQCAAIPTGTVDAAGNLAITNAALESGQLYSLHALVNGEHRWLSAGPP